MSENRTQTPVSMNQIESALTNDDNKPRTHKLSAQNYTKSLFVVFTVGWSIMICLILVSWESGEHNTSNPSCFNIYPYPTSGGDGSYDDDNDNHIKGKVCIEKVSIGNIYHYSFYNLAKKDQGGWHVHSGTSCDNSGGHYFSGITYDPWVNIFWNSNGLGVAKDTLDMSSVPLNVNGRTLVVHAPDGTRIGCGEIPGKPYK